MTSSRMYDIHSHILPEVDDGAVSWEMAVQMCFMAASDGIEHMVATPHANDEFVYERERWRELLNELQARVGPKPTLSLGCDFHFSYENLESLAEHPNRYTIDDTPYLLVEFSNYAIPPWVDASLQDLIRAGLRPVITHPERNPLLVRKPERAVQWAQMGCVVQVTASSIEGSWGDKAKQVSNLLMRQDAVHVLATDAHNIDGRPPVLSRARAIVAENFGAEIADALVNANPAAVVRGEELPYFPEPKG